LEQMSMNALAIRVRMAERARTTSVILTANVYMIYTKEMYATMVSQSYIVFMMRGTLSLWH